MLYLYPMASHSDRTMVRWQDHESHQIPCQSGQADLYFHYADIEFWALFDSHSSYTPRSVFQDGPDRWPTFTLTHIATRTIECTTLMATNQSTTWQDTQIPASRQWGNIKRARECALFDINAVNAVTVATIAMLGRSTTDRLYTNDFATRLCRLYPLPLRWFHALLNSLFKVLCNFPSRYLFAIEFVFVFSLRWCLSPNFRLHFQAARLQSATQTPSARVLVRGLHPLRLKPCSKRLRAHVHTNR